MSKNLLHNTVLEKQRGRERHEMIGLHTQSYYVDCVCYHTHVISRDITCAITAIYVSSDFITLKGFIS